MSEQKFDISIDRVEKIPVPLLVVGLGGTGCDALLAIKKNFAERYILPVDKDGQEKDAPRRTAYLGFDTLSERPAGFEINEYVSISFSGMEAILKDQAKLLHPWERAWVNHELRHTSNGIGAGTVRQAGRLAVCRSFDRIKIALQGAIENIVAMTAGAANGAAVNRIEVALVTGIGGGTGSGTFLDMAQIIRYIGGRVAPLPVRITGYIVMPDVSISNVEKTSPGMVGPIKHNAYAALKELDFWMRVKEHEIPYTMQYTATTSITWDQPPFDNCILMSSSNVNGVPYNDGYITVLNTIAENLMHYMANEDGVTNKYSYRQYEDNLDVIPVVKNRPVYYGYRSIGAFTKRIPKKSLLYYEGKRLLETFIPLRDERNFLQPDRRMFEDGQGAARAERITEKGSQLMQDFRTSICRLPNACSVDLSDKVKVATVQNMNPAPHNRWNKWRDEICAPAALTASRKYLDDAWDRFIKFATEIISDPAQGPFSLRLYLDDQAGLLSDLEKTLESWTSKKNTLRQSITQWEESCNSSWAGFCNPPILGRMKALELYKQNLKSLYTAVDDSEFLNHYVPALEKLILRIKEYLADGLKPMCATIEYLEGEFNTVDQSDAMIVQDIYQLDDVRGKIDDVFKEVNAENKLSVSFLQDVTIISMLTTESAEKQTSGVKFLCRSIGLEKLCEILQKKLTEAYGDVNNQSLDSIMINNVGDDVTAQQQWMSKLATDALDSALPMFKQDVVFQHESKVPYSYMSIPANAVKHLDYIKMAFATHQPPVEPKASSLTDHIYCLTAWDKLPLYRYADMEDLRRAYDDDLKTDGARGVHLVRNGDPDADFQSDWALLPSPKPYFLFTDFSTPNEMAQYEKVKELVKRGMDCGIIKVHSDAATASADIYLQYLGNALKTSETMMQEHANIKAKKDPATGDTYPQAEIAKELKKYLDSGRRIILEENEVKPSYLAHVLGLENEPCDPFDASIQADITALNKAQENHQKLCVAMIEALVYRRPDIVRALELQLPAVEEIYNEIIRGGVIERLWKQRIAFAPTAANIFVYLNDIIGIGTAGYRYKYKGEKYDIVASALQAEDLKDVSSDYVAAIGFLADAPDENASKATLTKLVNDAMKAFDDSVDSETITADEVQELAEAAKTLADETQEEAEKVEHDMRNNPSQKDILKYQKDLLQEVNKSATRLVKTFNKIAKGL